MSRATTSGVAPAANGTTILTCRLGHSCALATTEQQSSASAAAMARFISSVLRISQARRKTYHAANRTGRGKPLDTATKKLRTLLASGRITVAPGAYDGLSARLVEQAGFPAIYASGGAIARSTGIPDLGLLPMDAIVERLASMVDVVEAPIIADADTGYGNSLNAQAAARSFERAGVAGFHLED